MVFCSPFLSFFSIQRMLCSLGRRESCNTLIQSFTHFSYLPFTQCWLRCDPKCNMFDSLHIRVFFLKKKKDGEKKKCFSSPHFVYFGYVRKSICISLCSLFIWRWFVTKVLGAQYWYMLMMLINVLCNILNFSSIFSFDSFVLSRHSTHIGLTVFLKMFLTWIHCLTFSYPIPMINKERKEKQNNLLFFIFFFFALDICIWSPLTYIEIDDDDELSAFMQRAKCMCM